MATDANSITISGNVTRDPELRYTPSGASKLSFGVAVNRSWRNQQTQEWEEQTSFFNVVAWRQLAENAQNSITKGTRVVVNGRLEQRSWETDQGEKRSIVEIVADDIAASLRFATVDIHRIERTGGDGGFSGSRSGSGGGNAGGGNAGGGNAGGGNAGGGNAGGNVGGGGYDEYGEEPF